MAATRLRIVDLLNSVAAGQEVFFRYTRTVEDLMTTDVKTLSLNDTVHTALQFMKEHNCRHALVVEAPEEAGEEPAFVGVVSERDLFRQVSPYWDGLSAREEDARALKKPISHVVTRHPYTASPDTPLSAALQTMSDHRVDVLPVLSDGRPAGVITTTDIVRIFAMLGKLSQLSNDSERPVRLVDLLSTGSNMSGSLVRYVARTVKDIMAPDVVALRPTNVLRQAMAKMQAGRFRHIPVVDAENRVVGIVSDRDILLRLPFPGAHEGKHGDRFRDKLFAVDAEDRSLSIPLEEVMERNVVTVAPDCGIYEAANLMYYKKLGCLLVVEGDRLAGLITASDLLRAMLAIYRLLEKSEGPR